jgi:hypothetical protein
MSTTRVNNTGVTTSKTPTKVTFWIILPSFLQPLPGKGLGNALELYDNFCPPKLFRRRRKWYPGMTRSRPGMQTLSFTSKIRGGGGFESEGNLLEAVIAFRPCGLTKFFSLLARSG